MSPRWLHWPAADGDVDLASFSSNATSPSNPGIQSHTNLEQTTLAGDGGLLFDGRGLSNSFELKGSPSPDFFFMYFDDTTDANSANSMFSSFTLTDTTSSIDYALTTSVDSVNSRIKFLTASDSVWVSGSSYVLKGTP